MSYRISVPEKKLPYTCTNDILGSNLIRRDDTQSIPVEAMDAWITSSTPVGDTVLRLCFRQKKKKEKKETKICRVEE